MSRLVDYSSEDNQLIQHRNFFIFSGFGSNCLLGFKELVISSWMWKLGQPGEVLTGDTIMLRRTICCWCMCAIGAGICVGTDFASAKQSCPARLDAGDLGCDDREPGPDNKTGFAQAVTASITAGQQIGVEPSALMQFIDGEYVPPPDRWFPIATEPVDHSDLTGSLVFRTSEVCVCPHCGRAWSDPV